MARKSGLGRGLESLLGEAANEVSVDLEGSVMVPLSQISPNPDQPRKDFDEAALSELADSIRHNGLLQPILVRPYDGSYQVVAGERRYHAAELAGLEEIPVVVREIDDRQALVLALVENLQRSDLNAMEEARGYRMLIERDGFTQQQIADSLSRSRSSIANTLRLLDLPDSVQSLLADGQLTAGHARAILAVDGVQAREELANRVVRKGLSVRETENLASTFSGNKKVLEEGTRNDSTSTPTSFREAAQRLGNGLGTKVKVRSFRGRNRIEIEFGDESQLEELVTRLCSSAD